MKKRSDRNSTTAAVQQAQQAQVGLARWPETVPPSGDDLKDEEIDRIFAGIISTRPAENWSEVDRMRAAQLSQLIFLAVNDTALLVRSGTMIRGEKGRARTNPLMYGLEKINSQINHLCRALGLSIQTNGQGDVRDQMAVNHQFEQQHGRAIANGGSGQIITIEALIGDDG